MLENVKKFETRILWMFIDKLPILTAIHEETKKSKNYLDF